LTLTNTGTESESDRPGEAAGRRPRDGRGPVDEMA